MKPVLVDSNVLLDVLTEDTTWGEWSSSQLAELGEQRVLVINAVIYAEISIGFRRIEDLDRAVPAELFRRDAVPYEAGFLAGKAFVRYRKRGGARAAPLPDFLIGAHAAIEGLTLLTRDPWRIRTYFPSVEIIAP